jgi:hypothetical protein
MRVVVAPPPAGAADLVRWSFGQAKDLPPDSSGAASAIDRGFEALRVFNALQALVSL